MSLPSLLAAIDGKIYGAVSTSIDERESTRSLCESGCGSRFVLVSSEVVYCVVRRDCRRRDAKTVVQG